MVDCSLPEAFIKANKGPHMGVDAPQRIFKKNGPVTSVVPKPKIGMTTEEHVQVAMDVWTGGIDCVKDDENLTSQSFNKFEYRVLELAKARDKAENETGETKDAFINVTAETREMERRAKLLHDNGFRYFMIDLVTIGFSAMQTMRICAQDFDMAVHAHRAMHGSFTKHVTHGISMYFLSKLCRLIGMDQLHIGTVVGKLDSPKMDVIAMKEGLLQDSIDQKEIMGGYRLPQKWYGMVSCGL